MTRKEKEEAIKALLDGSKEKKAAAIEALLAEEDEKPETPVEDDAPAEKPKNSKAEKYNRRFFGFPVLVRFIRNFFIFVVGLAILFLVIFVVMYFVVPKSTKYFVSYHYETSQGHEGFGDTTYTFINPIKANNVSTTADSIRTNLVTLVADELKIDSKQVSVSIISIQPFSS